MSTLFADPAQYTPENLAQAALGTLPREPRPEGGVTFAPVVLELLIAILPEALRLVNNCMERTHPREVARGLQNPSLLTQMRVRRLVGWATRGRQDPPEVAAQVRQALYGLGARVGAEDLNRIRISS